jgi:ribosomal protein S18 acetylase RimI-like enzyme
MDIELREPKTEEEFERYYDLRWRILRKPWTDEKQSGRDQYERTAMHLAAFDGGKLVGAGRCYLVSSNEAQIRGMAVEQDYEKKGIGSMILQGLEERAMQAGARRIVLHARESALEFYRKNHYQVVERSYTLFHSIVHWQMYKDL